MIKVFKDILFPGIGVQVEDISVGADELTVVAAATVPPGRYPDCRGRASRVHSTYQRRLAERPASPLPVVVRLTVRRFFCDQSSCSRRTFAEPSEGDQESHVWPSRLCTTAHPHPHPTVIFTESRSEPFSRSAINGAALIVVGVQNGFAVL